MPDQKYVLTNGSNSSSTGATLNGCKIKVLTPPAPAPNEYEFYEPGNSTYLQKVSGPLPIVFEDISITKGTVTTTWDITVDSLPNLTDAGSWVTPSQHALRSDDTPPTQGDFTAATDGAFTGEEEEAAAAAGYGNQ